MASASDPTEPDTHRPGADEPLVSPAGEGPGVPARTGESAPPSAADPVESSTGEPASQRDSHNMLPGRDRRRTGVERFFVRIVATCGIVGIGVAIAAIMVSSNSQGWLVGLVVSVVSVVLAAVLWSSRQL